jgi:uncharacterized small protein (DUF1192 family)
MTIPQRASKTNANKLNKASIKEIETLVEMEVSEEKTNHLKSLKSTRGRTEPQKHKLSNQTKIDLEARIELLQQEIIKLHSTADRKFNQFKTINSLLSEKDMVSKLQWQASLLHILRLIFESILFPTIVGSFPATTLNRLLMYAPVVELVVILNVASA